MSLIHEYMLLIAVATPLFALSGMNVFLYMAGERNTLLLPVMRAYPTMDAAPAEAAAPELAAAPAAAIEAAPVPASKRTIEEALPMAA